MSFRRLMVFCHPDKHFLVYNTHTTGVRDLMAITFPFKPKSYVLRTGNFVMITELPARRQTHKLLEV